MSEQSNVEDTAAAAVVPVDGLAGPAGTSGHPQGGSEAQSPAVVHADPRLEAMRVELVRRGVFTPELPTDQTASWDALRQALRQVSDMVGSEAKAGRLFAARTPHPQGRTPYSRPRPGARKRRPS